jgi:putative pyruvate formate lyase activating enzyme
MKHPLLGLYENCRLCPRECGVNRAKGELGFCGASADLAIAGWMAHRFEEPPISGTNGSGTIFFSYCTSRCAYCQNYTYSTGKRAKIISIDELSSIMIRLQEKSCHNINLVTPSHYMPSIVTAIDMARKKGLNIPIIYNTNGYELEHALDMLKGFIDIYMPDAKYADNRLANKHCGFIDYSFHNIRALKKMQELSGRLELDNQGIAVKGLLVRHLILPGFIDNTEGVLELIAEHIGNDVYISFMSQYSPTGHIRHDKNLGRRLNMDEYKKAIACLEGLGFENGWVQDFFN